MCNKNCQKKINEKEEKYSDLGYWIKKKQVEVIQYYKRQGN